MSRLSAAALSLPLLPLLVLPLFALPQAEDFCWGAQGPEHGFFGGIAALYDGWSGRILPHGLMILPTLLADATGLSLLWVYRLLLLLALGGFLLFLAWLGRRLAERQPGLSWPLVAVALLYLLVAAARAPRDLLAWWPSVVTYVPVGCAALAVYLLLLRPPERGGRAAAVIAAAVAGLSVEFGGTLVLCAVACALLQRPQRWRLGLAVGAVAAVALLLLALSPGNAVRIAGHPGAGDAWRALWKGPLLTLEHYGQVLLNPSALGALLLLLWLTARASRDRPAAASPRESPWWPVLLAALSATTALALGVWATGGAFAARAQNALLLFGLPLLALALVLMAGRLPPTLERRVASRALGGTAVVLMLLGPLPWHALADIGEASAFAAGGAARHDTLLAAPAGAAVAVAPLPAYPLLLTQEEISADPQSSTNRCVSRYYRLSAVSLAGPGPAYAAASQPYWFAWPW
jgi:hypothetical protein